MTSTVHRLAALRDRAVTADAVYGTILFAAVIAVASDDDHPGGAQEPLEVLLAALTTLVVFWVAHVYARAIASHGVRRGEDVPLRVAVRRALIASNGMLLAAVIPTALLVLGALGVLPDADEWALWSAVLILATLGYAAFAERGSRLWARLIGAAATAVLGVVIIGLDAALH